MRRFLGLFRSFLTFLMGGAMFVSAAAACGGSHTDENTELGAALATGDEVAAVVVPNDRPRSFDDIDWSSPIQEFLGNDGQSGEDLEAVWADQQRQAEQVIAECMMAAGFEYVPRNFDEDIFFSEEIEELPYFSDEWVAKYGFGISTQRFAQSAVGANLVGYPDEYDIGFEDMSADPNQAIIDALSDAEREVYYETLHGPPLAVELDDLETDGPPIDPMMWQPQGCEGEAYGETDMGPGPEMEFWTTFGDQVQSMYERVESDPRVVAFDEQVSRCVNAAGHAWDPASQPWELFEVKLRSIGPDYEVDPFAAAGLNPEDMSDRAIEEFYMELSKLSDQDLDLLAQVQAEEIELAQVVVGCGGGELNRTWFTQPIQIEYEREFLNSNADQLAEFADS